MQKYKIFKVSVWKPQKPCQLLGRFLLSLMIYTMLVAVNLVHAKPSDSINFLVFSDIHLNVNQDPVKYPMEINPKGPVLDPLRMNLDTVTFVSMLNQIKSVFPKPPFLLITGDMAGYDPTYVYQDEEFVLQNIDSTFPDTPKILVFGNEDSLEKPYGAFYYPTGINDVHSTYELAMKMKNGWKNGFLSTGIYCKASNKIFPCIIDEDPKHGNFSLYVADNLRLIGFNSIVFSSYPSNQASQETTNAELYWIAHELQKAALRNENILLATHVPCGNDVSNSDKGSPFWRSNNQAAFLQLLTFYQKNIIGILAGHTHFDELKVLQNTLHQNVGATLITPGFVTLHGNSPGFRNYYLTKNDSNWEISNYVTYNFDPSLSLNPLYEFHNYYCPGTTTQNILACLDKVTAAKMSTYYTVGNLNYLGTIAYPNNIFITLPNISPQALSGGSSSGGFSTGAYIAAGAAAATGLSALLLHEYYQGQTLH